jgi:NAD+ synthase
MLPELNEDAIAVIGEFISQRVEESGGAGVVIGLSGGLDSATMAKLCVDALGKERVLAVFMPSSTTPEGDGEITRAFAESLGTEYRVIGIQPMVDAFVDALGVDDPRHKGNIMARCRMVVLYHLANTMGRVVMGTGNKSELLMGYFTKFGDGGADFLPLGDLYKTHVREVARRIGVPEAFISKPPSAGLWEGQTDEAELGIDYEHLDMVLHCIELQLPEKRVSELSGVPFEGVKKLKSRYLANVHKRKMPLIPKLGVRTIGLDWRE